MSHPELSALLAARGVTPVAYGTPREALLAPLLAEEYGHEIPLPHSLTFELLPPQKSPERRFCAGFAPLQRVMAHAVLAEGEFSFPFQVAVPKTDGPHPFFVHISFSPTLPNTGNPTEELIENGFAVLSLYYEDVTTDDGDLQNGLAGVLYPDDKRKNNDDPGKIAMWAWAARCVLSYALENPALDPARAAVIGHSRLGKTALLAAALDPRFTFAVSNDSGCSGAALSRGNTGERISDITRTFPYWFCENYKKYKAQATLPFDQHQLIAAIAPRRVAIGSAREDLWADPISEMLGGFAAAPAWGEDWQGPDRLPQIGDDVRGQVCYHLRAGEHYLARRDWHIYMDILKNL